MPKIIQNELLVDAVYNNLKHDILDNKYAGGQKLTIRELCESYGVSETPVKQALNRLSTEGLVENIPRKGMHVRHFYYENFKEIMEARNMIEQYAIDSTISLLKQDNKFREEFTNIYNESIVASKRYIETKDELDYTQNFDLDIQFHQKIVYSTQNQYIINMHKDLIVYKKMYYMCNAGIKVRIATVIEDHKAIFNGLINGDIKLVADVLNRHLCEYTEDDKELFNEFKKID